MAQMVVPPQQAQQEAPLQLPPLRAPQLARPAAPQEVLQQPRPTLALRLSCGSGTGENRFCKLLVLYVVLYRHYDI